MVVMIKKNSKREVICTKNNDLEGNNTGEQVEAMFWRERQDQVLQCLLCPHYCVIDEGRIGRCGVRSNKRGVLSPDSYGRVVSIALDPIEKKPLRMFRKGSKILSIGSLGCNMKCPFCQNYGISMEYEDKIGKSKRLLPIELVSLVKEIAMEEAGAQKNVPTMEKACVQKNISSMEEARARKSVPAMGDKTINSHQEAGWHRGRNIGVAYTYNEPLVGYEYVYQCAKQIRKIGLKNVLITNGLINPEPFEVLLPYIDAMNIDLKSFSEEYYKRLDGNLETVKKIIEMAAKETHLEITTLIIPGENDSEKEMKALASWLGAINPDIPLHISRFFPAYKYVDKFPTPLDTMYKLEEVAKKYLNHVFLGNV